MKPTAYSLQPSSRSGIALIMSLGVLSVMVIMAVAFAVAMRTERLAAGNYLDSIRARQLVQTGLARALNDLATNLGANGLMTAGVGSTNYPPWAVTNSSTNTSINTSGRLYLLYSASASPPANSATNFVPRVLWTAATNADYLSADNHWLAVESLAYAKDTNGVTYLADSNRLGTVKYLIINCSGLLDANFAGGMTRSVGTNVMEIGISNLPDFETGNAATFIAKRATDYRYETLEELRALNLTAFNKTTPPNFTVYSHAPAGYWPTNNSMVSNQVNLTGTYGDIRSRVQAISNGFISAGFTSNQAEILFNNLYNYMAPGVIPVRPGQITADFTNIVKAVPMINEILLESSQVGPNAVNEVTFEVWFPFVTTAPVDYQLQVQVDLSDGPPIPVTTETISFAGGNFATVTFPPSVDPTPSASYRFTIRQAEVLTAVNAPVDMLLEPSLSTPSAWVAIGNKASYQCIDPRINWNLFDTSQWTVYPGSDTLGATNAATLSYMAADLSRDQDGAMYVRALDEQLQSVGELGYLFYTNWRTVKLYGPNRHRVLDVFAIGDNAAYIYITNTIYRGRVNPNTRQAEVLSAVFSNMPIDQYPGELTAVKLNTLAEIQAIVNDIQTEFYTNVSQVGRYFADSSFPAAADNELKREAIFRNTAGLFSTRQNLFTIIIEGQVGLGGNIPRNPIRQRAVALVWRDPYTGEMFVRSIKWLRD